MLNDSCFPTPTYRSVFLDVQPPNIICPDNITSETTYVTFQPNVTDNADPMPIVTYDPLGPGNDFPYGKTSIVVTVTDESGNQANCSFIVCVQGMIWDHTQKSLTKFGF